MWWMSLAGSFSHLTSRVALTEVLVQPAMQVGRWPVALQSVGDVEINHGQSWPVVYCCEGQGRNIRHFWSQKRLSSLCIYQKAGKDPFRRDILVDPTDKASWSWSNYTDRNLDIININNKTFTEAIGTIISFQTFFGNLYPLHIQWHSLLFRRKVWWD